MRVHDQGLRAAGLDCIISFFFLIVNKSVDDLNSDLYIVKELALLLAGCTNQVFNLVDIFIAVLPPDDN